MFSSTKRKHGLAVAGICAMLLAGTACSDTEAADSQPTGTPQTSSTPGSSTTPGESTTPSPDPAAAQVQTVPAKGASSVRPDKPVTVATSVGTLQNVTLRDDDGAKVDGSLNEEKSRWTSEPQLKPGAKYTLSGTAQGTVGIQPGDPEYYNIRDVKYAQRVTTSGEFVHGAPWSSGSQGSENVSHGCVGMSLKDGAWYFAQTLKGDPVIVTGTSRKMEPNNGLTDWNVPWLTYKTGSALS